MTKELFNTDILIVGGGPADLTLAKTCEQNNLNYILIERNSSSSIYSKATGVHVNSMRILSEFGIGDEVVSAGTRLDKNTIIYNQEIIKEITFTHGNLPHELNFSVSQEKLENIIAGSLRQSNLLYNHRFQDWNRSVGSIYGEVRDDNSYTVKLIKAKIMVAADGGKSIIRKKLGLSFKGETNPALSFSFDAKMLTSLQPNRMFTFSNQYGRIVIVPVGDGIYKISGKLENNNEILDNEVLAKIVLERSGLIVDKGYIKSVTTYHTHSRIASQFKVGNNIFLTGDAAHIFYPAGGYGINMAIKDAYMLGNILNKYFHSHDNSVLDDFERERMSEAIQIQKDAVKKREMSMNTLLKEVIIESLAYKQSPLRSEV